MKILAHVAVVLGLLSLIAGLAGRFAMIAIGGVMPKAYLNAAMIFLLFGINFELLALLNKK